MAQPYGQAFVDEEFATPDLSQFCQDYLVLHLPCAAVLCRYSVHILCVLKT